MTNLHDEVVQAGQTGGSRTERLSSNGFADASPMDSCESGSETMRHVEYKVEQIHWKDDPESRLDQLAERLNELAKDGWRVASVDLTAHSEFAAKSLPVLLERDVTQPQ